MRRALLLGLASASTALGLLNLYSADLGLDGTIGPGFAAQATHALVGVAAFALLSRIPVERLRQYAYAVWGAGLVLLLATLVSGTVAGGARSWLALGPFRLQPSELMKLGLPLALAAELARPPRRRGLTRGLRRALLRVGLRRTTAARWGSGLARACGVVVLVGTPVVLIAAQPDMGAVGLLGLGALSLLWVAGLPRWLVAGGIAAGAAAAPLGWMCLASYQRARVLTFLHPSADPSGAGYQTLQSLAAVAAGGPLGRGFEAGTQGRLGFLPEYVTDFILAHLAEEWGLLGALLCLGLLLALVATGLFVAERSRDRFGGLLAAGLSLQLLWQVVVNVGGILGLMPLTGVTLPFFSYGGSSLLAVWTSVGLLAALAADPQRRRATTLQPLRTDRARTPAPRRPARAAARWAAARESA